MCSTMINEDINNIKKFKYITQIIMETIKYNHNELKVKKKQILAVKGR